MKKEVIVSVICVTYNHELYIKQALDSIMMQETDFAFEVLVGEDCSTDGTKEILKQYEQKYPNQLHVIYREKNVGATKNEYDLLMRAKGKYIASLELDDVWTDPLKLQKQYDFLEEHPEYIGAAHDFDIIDKCGNVMPEVDNSLIKRFLGHKYTLQNLITDGFAFQTGTHFYRNIWQDGEDYSIIYKADVLIRDLTILSILLNRSDFYVMPDNMSAYRRFFDKDAQNGRNLTNSNLPLDLYTKAHHVETLYHYFEGAVDYSPKWSNIILSYLKGLLKERNQGYCWNNYWYMYSHADRKTRKTVRMELCNSIKRALSGRKGEQ